MEVQLIYSGAITILVLRCRTGVVRARSTVQPKQYNLKCSAGAETPTRRDQSARFKVSPRNLTRMARDGRFLGDHIKLRAVIPLEGSHRPMQWPLGRLPTASRKVE